MCQVLFYHVLMLVNVESMVVELSNISTSKRRYNKTTFCQLICLQSQFYEYIMITRQFPYILLRKNVDQYFFGCWTLKRYCNLFNILLTSLTDTISTQSWYYSQNFIKMPWQRAKPARILLDELSGMVSLAGWITVGYSRNQHSSHSVCTLYSQS